MNSLEPDGRDLRGVFNTPRLGIGQLAEALASLEYALADLEKKRGDLQRTIIRAPYDGLVTLCTLRN